MEKLLLGMADFAIEKVISHAPPILEVHWKGESLCPHCGNGKLRIKDTFVRIISNIPIGNQGACFHIKCHKYLCLHCGKYFNTRLYGVKIWNRTTELLKRNIFQAYNKGVSCQDIAKENRIGVASVERY